LDSNKLDAFNVSNFKSLPSLETLSLVNNQISKLLGFDSIETFERLKLLDLSNNKISLNDKEQLWRLKNLENLILKFNNLSSNLTNINNVTKLKYLDVSHNFINSLLAQSFLNLTKLECLDLSNNPIEFIEADVFNRLKVLKMLYLNNVQLKSLDAYIINPFNKLDELDLGSNSVSNYINASFFLTRSITKLKKLCLGNTSLTNLKNITFKSLSNLEELDLSNNRIGNSVHLNAFNRMLNLKLFKLVDVGLTDVGLDLIFSSEFPCLLDLDLSLNKINAIRKNTFFNRTTTLVYLKLSRNSIGQLEDYAFDYLTHLKELDLSHNELKFIGSNCLKNLKSLMFLILSNNNIKYIEEPDCALTVCLTRIDNLIVSYNFIDEIPSYFFTEEAHLLNLSINNNRIASIKKGDLKNLNFLEELSFDQNQINTIEYGALNKMFRLEYLSLESNHISYLENELFDDLINLKKLSLSHNQISSLQAFLFSNLKKLERLLLSHNNLKSIYSDTFTGLGNLMTINLVDNFIMKFEENCFNQLSSLKNMYLSELVLRNDANLKNLASSLRNVLENSKFLLQGRVFYEAVNILTEEESDCKILLFLLKKNIQLNLKNDDGFNEFLNNCFTMKLV
jgi:toll-like receptor 13